MKSKKCCTCKIRKQLKHFPKCKRNKDGHDIYCKICHSAYRKRIYWEAKNLSDYFKKCPECNNDFKARRSDQNYCCTKCYNDYYFKINEAQLKIKTKIYNENNKAKIAKQTKKYRANNKKKLKNRRDKYYKENKETLNKKVKLYYSNNKEKIAIRAKKYRDEHTVQLAKQQKVWRDSHREQTNKYRREKYKNDPVFKIKHSLRTRTNLALRGNIKSSSTVFLTGCCVDYLMYHLQEQFTKGMSWDNHGGVEGWEIDHIRPCESFDLRKPSQQRKCFHYSNLQPLWRDDNLSKGSKYIPAT